MNLDFEKWQGCNNDFIVCLINKTERENLLPSLIKHAPKLCQRDGSAIGADGILVLVKENTEKILPHELVIINSDSSIAKNCGNGLRCAAGFIQKKFLSEGNQYTDLETISLNVEGREIICRYIGSQGNTPYVAVEMGKTTLNENNEWHQKILNTLEEKNQLIDSSIKIDELGTCSIGNPHIVIFNQDSSRQQILKLGPELQNIDYMDGINLHIATAMEPDKKDQQKAMSLVQGKISEIYKTFTWERGAGETQACGSGACSVAAIALKSGLLPRDQWVAVDMPGGRLYLKQEDEQEPVTMAGPAEFVFSGRVNI